MKKVRIGIVGLGIGKWHLENFTKLPGAEVTALCDLNDRLLNKTGAQFGVGRLYTDYRKLLSDANWYLMGCPKPVLAFGVTTDILIKQGVGFGMPAAKARKLGCDVEEFGAGFIRFDNGAAVYLDNAWAAHVPEDGVWNLRILGDKGGATLWPLSVTLPQDAKVMDATPDPEFLKTGFKAPTQFEHFLDCIRRDRDPISTAEQGLEVMKMLDGIYRSSKTGKAVSLK